MSKRIVSLLLVLCMVSMCASALAWDCSSCGTKGHNSNFCTNCGAPRPAAAAEPTAEPTPVPTAVPTAVPAPVQPAPAPAASGVKVGDSLYVGTYPQTPKGQDSTPIEWFVLDVQGDKALLLSRYGLERVQMNNRSNGSYWSGTTLRAWLNEDFCREAFAEEEISAILVTELENGPEQGKPNEKTSRADGGITKDRIFLLSYAEAAAYLTSEELIKCVPTEYAKAKRCNYGFNGLNGMATSWYWLRSPIYNNNFVVVDAGGRFENCYMHHTYGVARPAMWVSLSGLGY